jgi:hypothetical protein
MFLIEATANPRPVYKLCYQTQHPKQDHLLFAKSLCPKLKGVLPVWRKLFGLGL